MSFNPPFSPREFIEENSASISDMLWPLVELILEQSEANEAEKELAKKSRRTILNSMEEQLYDVVQICIEELESLEFENMENENA